MDSMSGGPFGYGSTITGQALYGAAAKSSQPSAMHKTAPAVAAGSKMSQAYFGIQLPVLIALGVLTWWLWREYD